ncbi:hypothetical protein [Sulfurospirillum cavolei]|uniref:hypothetical protein n=1 Tax=Sulfurospirillum cavolei TaxID=366522 RepID=UPI0005A782E1|nr:hypothetical protein [Sulfurospirillum cavolei]
MAKKYELGNTLLETVAREVVKIAQEEAPEKSGELKGSIDILSIGDEEAIVGHKYNDKIVVNWKGAKTIYPLFVHEGTDAHTITPRTKKALLWNEDIGYRKKVNHPGTKANPYFKRAIKNKRIETIIRKYVDNLVKQVAKDIENAGKM